MGVDFSKEGYVDKESIKKSDVFIVIMSKNWIQEPLRIQELEYAKKLGKPIAVGQEFLNTGLIASGIMMTASAITTMVDYIPTFGIPATAVFTTIFSAFLIERLRLPRRKIKIKGESC